MENVLQKIGKFLGEKFALIDEKFAKKTELETIGQNITSLEKNYKSADDEISQQLTAEITRAKQAENAKVNKVEGKELMPSPSATPGNNTFLAEDRTWKEIDLTEISGSISGLEEADTELNRKLNEEISRAKGAEAQKVDKIQGKGLSANDYTSGEKNKLGNLGPYINNVHTSYDEQHSLSIISASTDPQTGTNSENSILIPEANESNNGLMPSLHYGIVNGLGKDGIYMDTTGTPSHTWQLSKTSGDYTGPLIKNSGGVLELRTGTDDAYTDLILNDIVIKGNVTQEGSSFITNAETVETADNTILLNKGEIAAGVTKGHAGIEIDRGTLPMYKIYFDESDDRFKAGSGTDLWPIMLRDEESTLTDESTLIWDATNKRAKAGKNLDTELAKYLPLKGGKVSGPIQMTNTSIKFVNKSNKIIGALTPHVGDEGFQITALNGPITFATNESMVHFINSAYHKIWDEANDGEGSGLDADMLDGKHAADFATAVEGGYLPLSGGTLTGNLIITNKVDSSNNPIGIKSNNGNNIISRDGGSLIIGDTNNASVYIQSSSSANLYVTKGSQSYKVWHEGNDGDNSGLDADTLDGNHSSDFLPSTNAVHTGAFRVNPNSDAYSEGIRIASASNGWSNIQLGSDSNASSGFIEGQWIIGKNSTNAFMICQAGTESMTSIPSHGLGITANNGGLYFNGVQIPNINQIPDVSGFMKLVNPPDSYNTTTIEGGGFTIKNTGGADGENYTTIGFGDRCRILGDNEDLHLAAYNTIIMESPCYETEGFYETSDARLKSNIKKIKLNSEKIKLYEFDKGDKHSYGVIAQEVEKLYPSTVQEGKNGYKVVNYNEVFAIKCAELEKRIDALESKLIN